MSAQHVLDENRPFASAIDIRAKPLPGALLKLSEAARMKILFKEDLVRV